MFKLLGARKVIVNALIIVIVVLTVCSEVEATRYKINVRYYVGKQFTYRSRSRQAKQRLAQWRRNYYEKRVGNNRIIIYVNGKAYYVYR